MAAPKKPKKKVVSIVCTECGLPWENHGDDPTLEDCVRLLKEALAQARRVPPFQVFNTTSDNTISGTTFTAATPPVITKRSERGTA